MAQSIIQNKYDTTEILNWGTYNTVGQVLNLNDDITNYDFILIRSGSASGDAYGGGMYLTYIPKIYYGAINEQSFGVMYQLNGSFHSLDLKRTGNRQLTIQARFSTGNWFSGIRQIFGYKLKR